MSFTDQIIGPLTVGQTFTHEPNFRADFTLTRLQIGGTMILQFSKTDSANFYQLAFNATGGIWIRETVEGVLFNRTTPTNGTVATGDVLRITRDQSVVSVYVNDALQIEYLSANNNMTAVTGEFAATGNAGSISNLTTWPLVETTLRKKLFGSRLFGVDL